MSNKEPINSKLPEEFAKDARDHMKGFNAPTPGVTIDQKKKTITIRELTEETRTTEKRTSGTIKRNRLPIGVFPQEMQRPLRRARILDRKRIAPRCGCCPTCEISVITHMGPTSVEKAQAASDKIVLDELT